LLATIGLRYREVFLVSAVGRALPLLLLAPLFFGRPEPERRLLAARLTRD
jgi:hypothetical protein